ncbi:hypothetical protein BDW60DRAFT_185834 [Aspergillus nidulans var. acristatus]
MLARDRNADFQEDQENQDISMLAGCRISYEVDGWHIPQIVIMESMGKGSSGVNK